MPPYNAIEKAEIRDRKGNLIRNAPPGSIKGFAWVAVLYRPSLARCQHHSGNHFATFSRPAPG